MDLPNAYQTEVVQMKVIQNVSAEGITYLDENGQSEFIDLNECFENYVQESKSFGSPPTEEELRAWRIVGQRDFNESYIEFFMNPIIRFEFPSRHEGFDELIYRLRKLKWYTRDLT
jgi:hypothetical protein